MRAPLHARVSILSQKNSAEKASPGFARLNPARNVPRSVVSCARPLLFFSNRRALPFAPLRPPSKPCTFRAFRFFARIRSLLPIRKKKRFRKSRIRRSRGREFSVVLCSNGRGVYARGFFNEFDRSCCFASPRHVRSVVVVTRNENAAESET